MTPEQKARYREYDEKDAADIVEEVDRLKGLVDRLREELKAAQELVHGYRRQNPNWLAETKARDAATDDLRAQLQAAEARAERMRTVFIDIVDAFRHGGDLKPLIYGPGKALDLALARDKEKANG